jgi:hypothetical protein
MVRKKVMGKERRSKDYNICRKKWSLIAFSNPAKFPSNQILYGPQNSGYARKESNGIYCLQSECYATKCKIKIGDLLFLSY